MRKRSRYGVYLNCLSCSEVFYVPKCRRESKLYCSKKCMNDYRASNGIDRSGEVVLDDEDKYLLDKYSIYISHDGYAMARLYNQEDKKNILSYLHRIIMKAENGDIVDHINGNKLDNRKSNLRICTHSQNSMNASRRSDNKSGYRGVSYFKSANKWHSCISAKGRMYYLGRYNSKQQAINARIFAESIIHGPFSSYLRINNNTN